ncbi:MAG: RlmE family RNA methyltransferase, partial [Oligoflexia bacterium]|nr:RlmE family RNA methyltransferase [Oligoflexia bacterium]
MSFKVNDHYTKKAKEEGHVARSIYKLDEIDKKY